MMGVMMSRKKPDYTFFVMQILRELSHRLVDVRLHIRQTPLFNPSTWSFIDPN